MKQQFMSRQDSTTVRLEETTRLRRRLETLVRFYQIWASAKGELTRDWLSLPPRLRQSAEDARKVIEEIDTERERAGK